MAALSAHAASLGSESSVSVSSEYASNPTLAPGGIAAEAAAVLATVPVTYASEAESLEIKPSVRLAETHGVTQLLTNYQYLDAGWQLSSERSAYALGAEWHRDSTYYDVFERSLLRGRTLPRLEEDVSASWRRALSELSGLQVASSYTQVAYSAESNQRLDNYNYTQGSLTFDHTFSETLSADASIGYGRYALRQPGEGNDNRYVQASTKYQASEYWKLSAQIGYSRIASRSQVLLCCAIVRLPGGALGLRYVLTSQNTSGGLTSYGLNLNRQSEQMSIQIAAARSVQPTSFGAPLAIQTAGINVSHPLTERWAVNASLQDSRQSDTLARSGSPASARFESAGAGATWQWTEHWTIGMQAAYSIAAVGNATAQGRGASLLINVTRQLGRVRL